ncbi:MAG: alpha/beta hydrolase [Candidatus Glassbacteria bacterium]
MFLSKSILLAVFSLTAVVLILGLVVRLMENRLTFFPGRELEAFPADYGLEAEEVGLRPGASRDTLHGWYFAPGAPGRPVVLICHGNAGNISHRLEWLEPFIRRGYGALLFDYRGYGRSTGRPSEEKLAQDATAAYDFLVRDKGVSPRSLILFGRSIGAAPVVRLAIERPCGKIVLEGAFTNGRDMARKVFGLLPLHYFMKYRWDISGRIGKVRVPVLIIHGTRDRVVPFELGRRLAEAGNAELVSFWAVEGGDHLDAYALLGGRYYDRIEAFIEGQ